MWFFRLLVFFPSITFHLMSAEIFPWAFLAVCYKKTKELSKSITFFTGSIYRNVLPFVILLSCSALFSWMIALYKGIASDCLRSFLAYLNPLLIYVFLMRCPDKEITFFNRLMEKLLVFFFVLGLLQYSGIINFLNPLFRFIVPRGGATAMLNIGGRGVSLLSSEPSRAAFEMIFVYITCVYLQKYSKTKQYLLDFILFIFILLIIRSAMGGLLFLVYLFFKYKFKLVIVMLLSLALLLPIIGDIGNKAGRAVTVMMNILSNSRSLENIYKLLLNASGTRLISIMMSYKYAVFHPLGGGVGLWMHSSLEALNSININPKELHFFSNRGIIPIRQASYMGNVGIDLGILGIFSVLFLLKPIFSLCKKSNNEVFPIVFYFIFTLFISSAVGNPIPWVCMALVYRKYRVVISK